MKNGWPTQCISPTSKIQHDPCWRVVAGVYLAADPSVYTARHQSLRNLRREQEVVKPHPFVGRPPLELVIPECPEWFVWMQLA